MPIEPDELTPKTDPRFDLLIMREIQAITLEERMRPLMTAVAEKLQDVGVDFTNADMEALRND